MSVKAPTSRPATAPTTAAGSPSSKTANHAVGAYAWRPMTNPAIAPAAPAQIAPIVANLAGSGMDWRWAANLFIGGHQRASSAIVLGAGVCSSSDDSLPFGPDRSFCVAEPEIRVTDVDASPLASAAGFGRGGAPIVTVGGRTTRMGFVVR